MLLYCSITFFSFYSSVVIFISIAVKCLFYVKRIEMPLCMKCAILIKLPCLATDKHKSYCLYQVGPGVNVMIISVTSTN